MKNASGTITGTFFGTLFLIGGIALWIFAPDFSGFFDRGHSEDALPVWVLLLILAALNYGYAGLSRYLSARTAQTPASGTAEVKAEGEQDDKE